MGLHITLVVPTFREVENLPHLIDRIGAVRRQQGYDLDLLIMDDNSLDGSRELVDARPEAWVTLVERTADRGLARAVLDGFSRAHGEFLVCMDADLSHPPEAMPEMIARLHRGADFVVASRYVAGGSTAHEWGVLRRLNSAVATALARPLTHLHDPMAGFFAMRRTTFERGQDLAPLGYKIGLELLVKCRCQRVEEIPIHFDNRYLGKSKLTIAQQLLYIQHLLRLYRFKLGSLKPQQIARKVYLRLSHR